MCSEVGIDPQSLSYGFLNEIMDHPCSDGGLGSDRIGCTKFNDGCTKFCEGCTKGSKVRSEVRIDPNHFLIGSKMKSWTIHVQMGEPKAIGSDLSAGAP